LTTRTNLLKPTVTHLIGNSRLKEALGIRSWYSFHNLRSRGVIPWPSPFCNGDVELWPVADIPKIQEKIDEYQRNKSAAIHNSLQTV